MDSVSPQYAARLEIDFPDHLDRPSSFFRLPWIIPIAVVAGALSGTASDTVTTVTDGVVGPPPISAVIAGALFAATLLMIVFRRRSPGAVLIALSIGAIGCERTIG